MGQRADRIEADVAPQLEPDLGADIVEHRRLEAGVLEAGRYRLHPLARGAVQFPQRETRALDVPDDARRHQFGGRIHHAAEHPLRWNAARQFASRVHAVHGAPVELAAMAVEIPERYAVLHRHHHGAWTEQLADLGRDAVDLVRLERQDHQVLLAGRIIVVRRAHLRGDPLLPVHLDELDAVRADRRQIGAPHDECHLLARQRQPGADQAADCSRSDNCDLHDPPLVVYSNRLMSFPMPSISTSIVLPGRIEPTPTDVPHSRRSPGSNVMSWEIRLTSSATGNTMSLIG